MQVKSKKLKQRNLPKNQKKIDHITSKPYLILGCSILVGCILLFTKYYLIGTLLFAMFFYEFVAVKDREIVAFYETYALFYEIVPKDCCYILYYDEIVSWKYISKWNQPDYIEVLLKNGKRIQLLCNNKRKMMKHLPKREEETKDSMQKVVM